MENGSRHGQNESTADQLGEAALRLPPSHRDRGGERPPEAPVIPSLHLQFLALSQTDLPHSHVDALAPRKASEAASAPSSARGPSPGRPTLPSSARSAAQHSAAETSRAEMMKIRHDMTRERVRLREMEIKRKAEAQMASKFTAPKNVLLPEYLRKEKKRRDEMLEQKNRCNELHALLKGGAFAWLPAQPPPPPPHYRD